MFLQAPLSSAPIPNYDFTGIVLPEQATWTPPSWVLEDGIDFSGQTQSGYASISDLMSIYGNT